MISKIISAILIILLMPFFFVVSILKILFDGAPIFFKQERLGKAGRVFIMYKFRTMKNITPKNLSTLEMENPEMYNTRIGNFLRKYSIDELPQLLNILKGDMNFIGPRPSLPNEELLNSLRKRYGTFKCTPGVTGWAQVNGRDNNSFDRKAELELFYMNNRSIFLDLKIIFLTLKRVIIPKCIYPEN